MVARGMRLDLQAYETLIMGLGFDGNLDSAIKVRYVRYDVVLCVGDKYERARFSFFPLKLKSVRTTN